MTGILLVAHGSRKKETVVTMEKITQQVREQLQMDNVECAFMEFCDVNIEKGLEMLIAKGVNDIKVVPYFLFEGVHIHEDIPGEIEKFKEKHSDVKITFGNTLGTDKRLAMIVADRIREII